MQQCPCCGAGPFSDCTQSLNSHFRNSPWCEPPEEVEKKDAAPQKRSRTASSLFQNRLHARLRNFLMSAHFDKYMPLNHLQVCVTMVVGIVMLVLSFLESEVPAAHQTAEEVRTLLRSLPSVNSLIAEGTGKTLRVEPLVFQHAGAKKGGVFFSMYQLVAVMLQESAEVRRHVLEASDEWKTGDLFEVKPGVYSDLTHGRRFRSRHDICGKATPEQSSDIRVVIHGWTDEFTSTDGLGVNAKQNKYGAVLGSLVNLPLHLRHNPDFILLLALYRSTYAKLHGGLNRFLTGIGVDGTLYADGLTLAAEVSLPGIEVRLPSDKPDEDDEPFTLRIFILLWSLDWLAHGDFGPYAKSVSARRPCFKCLWTQDCDCAFLSHSARNHKDVEHAECCRSRTARTHAEVMREVEALRNWQGTATALAKERTNCGLFSNYFPSEHLLDDVVCDATVDIMHVFFCGWTRYLLSFLFDLLIPAEFSWAELNRRAQAHCMPKGVKLPLLEPRDTGKKRSRTMKMNAAQTMYFTLAR